MSDSLAGTAAVTEPTELVFAPMHVQADMIRRRELSPVRLTEAYLDRIRRWDPMLRAYITVTPDLALQAARRAESEIAAGRYLGPLHGIPFAVKDQMWTSGVRTTAASPLLREFIPTESATAVSRLQNAGAILLGKHNLDQWGKGGTTKHYFGQPRNPWDFLHSPSGSSSGSGIAVSAGLCSVALGEDTGGSVRQPAAANGVVGLRPTLGRVSRFGGIMYGWTSDCIGPLTRTVRDAAIVLEAIAGFDERDAISSRQPVPRYQEELGPDLRGLRVGVVDELADAKVVAPQVLELFGAAVEAMRVLGAEIQTVSLPYAKYSLFLLMLTTDADIAAAFLHHGLRDNWQQFDPGTRRRLAVGALVPSAIHNRAMRGRRLVRRQILQSLENVDLLVSPTNPVPPAPIAAQDSLISPDTNMGKTRRWCTFPFATANTPTASVPCGFTEDGLPVGLQIAGRPFEEGTVLRAAHAYEQATPWHQRHPDLVQGEIRFREASDSGVAAVGRDWRDIAVSDVALSRAKSLADAIDLPIPAEDLPEIAFRLDALLAEMRSMESAIGDELNALDPIPPVELELTRTC